MNYFMVRMSGKIWEKEDIGKGRHRKREDGERVWQEGQIFKGINLRG